MQCFHIVVPFSFFEKMILSKELKFFDPNASSLCRMKGQVHCGFCVLPGVLETITEKVYWL